MTPATAQQDYEDSISARWQGGPTVLAFLFARPDSPAISVLDAGGGYFDVRTGDTWDLFFSGYFRSPEDAHFERQASTSPVGQGYAGDWYFDPVGFDMLRDHVERSSTSAERPWKYSGGTDLVLVNGLLVEDGDPTIDWVSTKFGQLNERNLTLGEVIERITRDLKDQLEDEAYGVAEVVGDPKVRKPPTGRDLMLSALSGILGALGSGAMGS